jgi:hypothetical protein
MQYQFPRKTPWPEPVLLSGLWDYIKKKTAEISCFVIHKINNIKQITLLALG